MEKIDNGNDSRLRIVKLDSMVVFGVTRVELEE